MVADGSNPHPLTNDNAPIWVSDWSPDGNQIAFTSNRDGNREIYRMDADGSNLQRLTNNKVLDGIPAWRPGASAFAFGRRYIPGTRFLTRGVDMVRFDLLRGQFGFFLGAMFFFYLTQNLVVPLFPTYSVDKMGMSDSAISLGTAFFQVAVFFTSMRLGQVSARLGHHRLMVISVLGYAAFPLFIGLVPTVPAYMLGAAAGGIGWGFLGGALGNRLMERVPENDRPAHMALFNITLNLGVLAGSLMGPVLGDWAGLQAAMVIGGVVRILSAVVLWRWG